MAELVSTRDPEANAISYQDALLAGLAPDGGLYVPKDGTYPQVSPEELRDLQGHSYIKTANVIKGKLIDGEIPSSITHGINTMAYDSMNFSGHRTRSIAPVEEVEENLYIQNLSLGPTAAFKDFGLRSLAGEVAHVLGERDETLTILAATSGDTGSAAEAAFKGLWRVSMLMLSPLKGSMTPFQRAQMGILSSEQIHNLSLDGSFDDCQDMVKAIKKEDEFKDLGAVNSINWGRIVAQVVYYFNGYLQVADANAGQEVDFVVPTGNFGNILSGHVARRMGLPIRNLVAATNENSVVHQLIQTGDYVSADKPVDTSSPSMDITKASNYERLAYEIFEGDPQRLGDYMRAFEASRPNRVSLADHGLGATVFKRLGIDSDTATHQDRLETMRHIHRSSGMVIDPHTADGVTAALRRPREVPTICLATALPVKFEETVKAALDFVPTRADRFKGLEKRDGADNFTPIGSTEELKTYIREHRS